MELSAAEEYAIRIIAAESALQHAARDEAPAARPSASTAVMPDGKASSPASVAGGTATPETNHPAPIPLPVALPVPPIPDGLWPAVRSELEAQSVIGYPANAIESLGLSPADQAEYLARAGKNLSSWYRLMMAQDSVLAEFRQAGIPVAVLKGAAAAANYPQPNSRSMGDIDLIVPPDHFEQAFSLMERLGWENDIELEINPRHAGFKKAGCPEIELHRYFSTCTNKQQAHFLDQAIYDAIPRAEWTDVAGFSVPVLPPLENGLVLLAHVNQHLGSGLGLRQILDWQMFVDAHLADELWGRGFQHAAQQIGMEKLAVTTTWLCRTYLGLQASATWWRSRRAACERPSALHHAAREHGAQDGARRAGNPHGAAQPSQPRGLGSLSLRGRARSLGASAQARVACSGSVPLPSGARYPQGTLAQREHERARHRRT